ncbi:hypothetical protein [Nonomuraea sp. NPDC003804]|uniref:nucleotidyltransferase domain-containing protein n=1 Tax=Nonomuraea sp. NPDC003804 TaxID=3154547 RepID=UPI0033B6F68E
MPGVETPETPWGCWEPAPLEEVVALFGASTVPWWVSGGYAIELAVGRPFREHGDVDVSVLRRDHLAVRRLLAGWDCHVADPPGTLRPWPVGILLTPFHNMALMCPDTTRADVDRHGVLFREAVEELVG